MTPTAACSAILVVVALILVALWLQNRRRQSATASPAGDEALMPYGPRLVLVAYLIASGILLVYLIAKLLSVDFPESPFHIEVPAQGQISMAPSGSEPPTPAGPDTSKRAPACTRCPPPKPPPALFDVFPQTTLGTAPSFEFALYGRNFDSVGATVRFNHQIRGKKQTAPNLIRVVADPADLIGVGTLVVDVANPDGQVSNALTMQVIRPKMKITLVPSIRPLEFAITREVQLILLVLCAGALGSYLHAVKSLADFIGNRTLVSSWFWWYITRPFLGMALAFVFYTVLRGGFLTGTPADVRVVNPFGAMAVAALVGMFADRASQKLAEIFDALFKGDDPRGGKLTSPVITKLEPSTVRVNQPNPPPLKIFGEHLGKILKVKLGGEERSAKTISERELEVQTQASDISKLGDIAVSVITPEGTASQPATLHVSDLAIATPSPLPPRVVDSSYEQTFSATGGTAPYTWTMTDAPDWLKLDPTTGKITGTPKSEGPSTLNITVTDKTGASVTGQFTLP